MPSTPYCRGEARGVPGEGEMQREERNHVLHILRCQEPALAVFGSLALAWILHRLGLTSWASRFFATAPHGAAMAYAFTFIVAAVISGAVYAVLHEMGIFSETLHFGGAAPDGVAPDPDGIAMATNREEGD